MAFADLMTGTVALPIYIYRVGTYFQICTGGQSMFWFIFYMIVDTISTQVSSISATFISGERLYATYWPLKHRVLSMRAYRIVIVMVWTLSLLIATVWTALKLLISTKHSMYPFTMYALFLIFYLILIICGCNIGIWRKFQHGTAASQQQNRVSQEKRLTKTLLFVSILALLSWLPMTLMHYLIFVYQTQIPSKFYLLVVVLTYSNSFVNPLVYALRIPEFRKALVLCCLRTPAAPNIVDIKRNKRKEFALTPATELRKLQIETSNLQLAFEQEVQDTKF